MKTKVEYQPLMKAHVVSCFVNDGWEIQGGYERKEQAIAIAKRLSINEENTAIYFENGKEIQETTGVIYD